MSRRILITVILIAAFIIAATITFQMGTVRETTVKIAFVSELDLEIDQLILNGAQLALNDYDALPDDVIVELVPVNVSENTTDEAIQNSIEAAQMLGDDDSVVAVIGGLRSQYARSLIPVYNEMGMAYISPSATYPGFTESGFAAGEPSIFYPSGNRNFFRSITGDDIQGRLAAEWLSEHGVETVYVFRSEDDLYSQGIVGILQANAEDLGLAIVGEFAYNRDEDPQLQVENLLDALGAANADALYFTFVGGFETEGVLFEVRGAYPDLLVMGSEAMVNVNYTPSEQVLLEGVYATGVALPSSARVEDFYERYRAIYDAEAPLFAVTAHDAMLGLLQIIAELDNPTRENVLTAMQSGIMVDGVLGEWTYDENGDTTLVTLAVMRYEDGEWVPVE